MSDGWIKVAERLGRGEATPADPEATGGEAPRRGVPAGWEALALRRSDDHEPATGEPVEGRASGAPAGWEAVARRHPSPPRHRPSEPGPGPGTTSVEPVGSTDAATPLPELGEGPADGDEVVGEGAAGRRSRPRLLAAAGRRSRPRLLAAAGAVTVLIVVGVVLGLVTTSGGGLPADAAFSVDGKVTTVAQLKARVNVLDQMQGITPPAQTDKSAYDAFLRTSAQALAVQQLVGDIAKKEGITVPQKTTRSDLDQLIATKFANNRSQFDAALSTAGLNEGEVLDALNAQAVENALYSRHTDNHVQVTPAQVAQTYRASQPLTEPEQRAISIIVVATQATAQDVINQLNGGASFATLASQDSLDASKSSGGADGTYSQADLQRSGQTALASAVFGATPNVPFGPLQANGGEWVVGEVTSVTPAQSFTDDAQTQAAIKNYLTDQQLRQQWIAYLGAQLKTADIHYASAYRPADPHQPPQPALPSVLQFVVNAHAGASSPATPPPAGP